MLHGKLAIDTLYNLSVLNVFYELVYALAYKRNVILILSNAWHFYQEYFYAFVENGASGSNLYIFIYAFLIYLPLVASKQNGETSKLKLFLTKK